MFFVTKPSELSIREVIRIHAEVGFSYPEVGATRTHPPPGYVVDHNRIQLGSGEACFRQAIAALKTWKQFDLGWVQAVPPDTPIEAGATIAVLVHHLGFWSLNLSRIVYSIEEHGPLEIFGFAYGTLRTHVERGEERFTIEWQDDNTVWYDILAFSRPNTLFVRLGLPFARMLQKRFARDSLKAMAEAVNDEVAR